MTAEEVGMGVGRRVYGGVVGRGRMLYRMYLEVILSYETQHCAQCTFTNKRKKDP